MVCTLPWGEGGQTVWKDICQSYHFRNTDIQCLVCLYQTVGDTLLADTSVSYPGILLVASAFCAVVAFRCCEMKS